VTEAVPAAPVALFGAAPDTGNLGVSALCYAILGAFARRSPMTPVVVFDGGRALRRASAVFSGRQHEHWRCGASYSRRFYRRDNLWNMRVCGALGGLGNPGARLVRGARAVLDISGGDSFTDLYGPRVFRAITFPKRMALDWGIPLVLLPQTYGPFASPARRDRARSILLRAEAAWARDPDSYERLRELLGSGFDPRRHRCGVDVAFGLEVREPAAPLPVALTQWLDRGARPVVGINVSGLILNQPEALAGNWRFVADYREILVRLVTRLLREAGARIVFVPHVRPGPGPCARESDVIACQALASSLAGVSSDRITVLTGDHDQSQVKWVLSRLDWVCGTRMHACIAALSSGVPTAAIAYSDKTRGVFGTCGVAEAVVDPRQLTTEAAVAALWATWTARDAYRCILLDVLPGLQATLEAQMDHIVGACVGGGLPAPDAAPSPVGAATRTTT
jgi:polysaccharide pyruvyl transferase WcaK-like protein